MPGPMLSAPVSAQIIQQNLPAQAPAHQKLEPSKFDQALARDNSGSNPQAFNGASGQPNASKPPPAAQDAQLADAVSQSSGADKAYSRRADLPSRPARPALVERPTPSSEAAAATSTPPATAASTPATVEEPEDLVASVMQSVEPQEDTSSALMRMISDIERGQGVMDRLIEAGLSGREFSSSELLALQAGMYKYTQELELTGKVVEKATTGLKDTLKTQV